MSNDTKTMDKWTATRVREGLRVLQERMPWGAHDYTAQFQARGDEHRDANHATLHVLKAAGKLAAVVEEFDHTEPFSQSNDPERGHDAEALQAQAAKALADLVICAARIADRWPGGPLDLGAAVVQRIAGKFPQSGKDGG
jgi:hypothetical protein